LLDYCFLNKISQINKLQKSWEEEKEGREEEKEGRKEGKEAEKLKE